MVDEENPHDVIEQMRGEFAQRVEDISEFVFFKGSEDPVDFEEALANYLNKIIDRLYPAFNDIEKTEEILFDSVKDMTDKEEIITYIWLLASISVFPIYYHAHETIILELKNYRNDTYNDYGCIDFDQYPYLQLGSPDYEIADIHICLELRPNVDDKLEFLFSKKKRLTICLNYPKKRDRFSSLFKFFNFSGRYRTFSDYIEYVDKYIILLENEKRLLPKAKLKASILTGKTFIDQSVSKLIYELFSQEENIDKNYADELKHFFQTGKLKSTKKIFFKKRQNYLAYCFYQLAFKNSLINNISSPDGDYTEFEIANIISECFTVKEAVNGVINVDTLTNYLIKGKTARPLNPLFIINKNEDKFDVFKPEKRKRGDNSPDYE
jgi:hypothetical protein